VRTTPCAVVISPTRARPSAAIRLNEKGADIGTQTWRGSHRLRGATQQARGVS
jgi:hypothetical protein